MLNVLISAIVALTVAVLTGQFAAVRSHDDRVWARKAVAYAAIFAALSEIADVYGDWLQEYFFQSDPPEEIVKARRGANERAQSQLFLATDGEVWLLPESVPTLIKGLRKELNERHEGWFDHIDTCLGAVNKTSIELSKIAREDMSRSTWIDKLIALINN